jgi:hypothetical protein
MPSSYVSGRVMSGQTEHSRAIIVGYVPSGHYFTTVWSLFHDSISDGQRPVTHAAAAKPVNQVRQSITSRI